MHGPERINCIFMDYIKNEVCPAMFLVMNLKIGYLNVNLFRIGLIAFYNRLLAPGLINIKQTMDITWYIIWQLIEFVTLEIVVCYDGYLQYFDWIFEVTLRLKVYFSRLLVTELLIRHICSIIFFKKQLYIPSIIMIRHVLMRLSFKYTIYRMQDRDIE